MKPEDLAGTAGRRWYCAPPATLLRDLVAGMMDMLHDRAQFKEHFRLPQTIIRAEPNNPLKFSASTADALRFLLGDSERFIPETRRCRPSRRQRHQAARKGRGQRHAPGARGLPGTIRSGRAALAVRSRSEARCPARQRESSLKYWELYEESYQVLTQHQEGQMPMEFRKDFAQAYEQQVSAKCDEKIQRRLLTRPAADESYFFAFKRQ